jgi:hypothetical protein
MNLIRPSSCTLESSTINLRKFSRKIKISVEFNHGSVVFVGKILDIKMTWGLRLVFVWHEFNLSDIKL